MSKFSFAFILKGLLIGVVYFFLAVNFVFLSPKSVPELDELEVYEIGSDDLYCVESSRKNPAYTRIMGILNGKEIKSYEIGTDRCREVFGISSTFIQMKAKPDKYKIYIEEDKGRIFGEGWLLYQIEANGQVLLSYDETSKNYLSNRMKFFYIGLGVLLFFTVILIVNICKYYKTKTTS